ncbi:MAG: hypothetical protein QNL80_06860 [Akkermansiaceae bacterium]
MRTKPIGHLQKSGRLTGSGIHIKLNVPGALPYKTSCIIDPHTFTHAGGREPNKDRNVVLKRKSPTRTNGTKIREIIRAVESPVIHI